MVQLTRVALPLKRMPPPPFPWELPAMLSAIVQLYRTMLPELNCSIPAPSPTVTLPEIVQPMRSIDPPLLTMPLPVLLTMEQSPSDRDPALNTPLIAPCVMVKFDRLTLPESIWKMRDWALPSSVKPEDGPMMLIGAELSTSNSWPLSMIVWADANTAASNTIVVAP